MFSYGGNIVKLLKQAKWGFIKNHYFNVLCGIKIYMRLFIFKRMPLPPEEPLGMSHSSPSALGHVVEAVRNTV
jgi:hypothetical protein